nr:hypothetical protein [Tanacetum cinerariifolium]
MKQARKESKDNFIIQQHSKGTSEGSIVIQEVPDEPSGNFSSSSFELKESKGFLPTDDEASPNKSDAKNKTKDAKDADKQAGEHQAMDQQIRNDQAEDSVLEPQVEKPAISHPSSSLTLSSTEYSNQFINDNPDALSDRLIKLETKVDRMSMIDHTNVIKTSVQANMMNEVRNQLLKFLPKVVSEASRSFLNHEKHLKLYNSLINSMDTNEANVHDNKDTMKRRHDKQDPLADEDKELKNRKRNDIDTSSSKKGKIKIKASKEAKALTKPSTTSKVVKDEERIQDDVEDEDEVVQDDDIDADDMPHDDAAPMQDRSK